MGEEGEERSDKEEQERKGWGGRHGFFIFYAELT